MVEALRDNAKKKWFRPIKDALRDMRALGGNIPPVRPFCSFSEPGSSALWEAGDLGLGPKKISKLLGRSGAKGSVSMPAL